MEEELLFKMKHMNNWSPISFLSRHENSMHSVPAIVKQNTTLEEIPKDVLLKNDLREGILEVEATEGLKKRNEESVELKKRNGENEDLKKRMEDSGKLQIVVEYNGIVGSEEIEFLKKRKEEREEIRKRKEDAEEITNATESTEELRYEEKENLEKRKEKREDFKNETDSKGKLGDVGREKSLRVYSGAPNNITLNTEDSQAANWKKGITHPATSPVKISQHNNNTAEEVIQVTKSLPKPLPTLRHSERFK